MKRAAIAILLTLLIPTMPASANGPVEFSFGQRVGLARHTGDPADRFKSGPAMGLFAELWLSPRAALGADVAYTHFFWEGNPSQNVSGESLRPLLVGAHVKIRLLRLDATSQPWIEAGAGVAMVRHRVEYYRLNAVGHPETFLNEGKNSPAVNLGAGLGLWNNGAGVNLGLSANYAWIFGDLLIDELDGSLGSESAGQQLSVGLTLAFERATRH